MNSLCKALHKRGSVFTSDGKNELDVSIMTGHDLNAGAVAGVPNIGNPISVARAVMEKSEHVMLAGNGASAFAEHMGLEIVDPSWFYTKAKFELYQRAKENEKHGTIGCVAHDISALIEYKGYSKQIGNSRLSRITDYLDDVLQVLTFRFHFPT